MPRSIEWFAWRPVFSDHTGHVSKAEIDRHWSIVDLVDCHALIDLHEELERRSHQKAKRSRGKG